MNVNGVDDPCTQQEDINFEFVGFSITGKVSLQGITCMKILCVYKCILCICTYNFFICLHLT